MAYVTTDKTPNIGLDFSTGKWLLNEIDAPTKCKDEIKNLVLSKLSKTLFNRLNYIYDVNGLLLPRKINLNPTRRVINEIKIGTGYDYFINLKSSILRNDLTPLSIETKRSGKIQKNIVEVVIEIYDLNKNEIVYISKMNGITKLDGEKDDIHFIKSSEKIILNCVKKILNEIEKNR